MCIASLEIGSSKICTQLAEINSPKYSLMQYKKVKFSHTRYRALGPELIPRYTGSEPAGDVKWITP